jgi:hypothetical protein
MEFKELIRPNWKKLLITVLLTIVLLFSWAYFVPMYDCSGGKSLIPGTPDFCGNTWMYIPFIFLGWPVVTIAIIDSAIPGRMLGVPLILTVTLTFLIQIVYFYFISCWSSLIRFRRKK